MTCTAAQVPVWSPKAMWDGKELDTSSDIEQASSPTLQEKGIVNRKRKRLKHRREPSHTLGLLSRHSRSP